MPAYPGPRQFRRLLGALGVLVSLSAASWADGSAFLTDVDDLPLAPGLAEDTAARVMFDKPGGRVVEAAARGNVSREAVMTFYRETLPALGWVPAGTGTWQREREILRIEIPSPGPPVEVRYAILPGSE